MPNCNGSSEKLVPIIDQACSEDEISHSYWHVRIHVQNMQSLMLYERLSVFKDYFDLVHYLLINII